MSAIAFEAAPAFREESLVLTGRRSGAVWLARGHRAVRGEASRVEADWRWALEREERRGDVLGFFHTHPPGTGTAPSPRDIRTMQAWCGALGKPLLCVIACAGETQSTIFQSDEHAGRDLPITECFGRNVWVIVDASEMEEKA